MLLRKDRVVPDGGDWGPGLRAFPCELRIDIIPNGFNLLHPLADFKGKEILEFLRKS
jgi:hypothetical protein